ncbi:hypothetical protein N7535_000845 [Penicillium sp. DV-2018c]|nr:hypothetical protein N7535_000845 [Penicillium sp. DV-2018c]
MPGPAPRSSGPPGSFNPEDNETDLPEAGFRRYISLVGNTSVDKTMPEPSLIRRHLSRALGESQTSASSVSSGAMPTL